MIDWLFSRWKWQDIAAAFHPAPEPDLEFADDGWDPPLEALPTCRAEVYKIFGDPGAGKPSKKFQRQNLVVARNLPGHWNSGKGRLYTHRLAEPYLREALRRCEARGVIDEIDRLGCYNFRHMRHDPRMPLSYHSWAIAIDINPKQNFAKYYKAGEAPEPFSDAWREVWPEGLSQELVECFESVGWSWGGRWKRFVDGMHLELVA